MNHLIDMLPAVFSGTALCVVLWFLWKQYKKLSARYDTWKDIPAQVFCSAEEIRRNASLASAEDPLQKSHLMLWCLAWLLFFPVQLLSARNAAQTPSLLLVMDILAAASLPFSLTESLLLKKYTGCESMPASLVRFFGWSKWIMMIAWCAVLFVNLVWRGWQL